ncbi:hypothetical protein XarbCFBP8138_09090 [Xanthomonas arboricola]|nr:hypothetical protein XarbCFBP8138_09090 [Xanthomonas arboricola]
MLGHVPLKVDAHQWQARKDAYAMRQLSFFHCWYFFSLMSAEAAEADAVRYTALVPAEVGTCASQRLTSELAHRWLLDLLRCGQAGSAASKERWICPCAKLMDGQFPPMWRRMKRGSPWPEF